MKAQNSTPEEIGELVSQFAAKGYQALHGGRKGNGFWIYDANNACLENNGKKSGNRRFWTMQDAKKFIESL